MNSNNYQLDSLKVSNFRSFFEGQEVIFNHNVIAFYGANASGKSNIYRALVLMKNFIMNSTLPNTQGAPYEPFLLRHKAKKLPSTFEVTFSHGDKQFRYMFSINADSVVEEAMHDLSTSRERLLFRRSKGYNVTTANNNFGTKIFETTRPNSLLITRAYEYANKYAAELFGFLQSLNLITVGGTPPLREMSINILQRNPQIRTKILRLLRKADFPIRDFTFSTNNIPSEEIDGLPFSDAAKNQLRNSKFTLTQTLHAVRNDDGDIVEKALFNMDSQESLGTNVFFDIILLIVDTISNGRTLYIDEFNSSLHIDICELIIKLFKENKTGAKLIINTHDVGLMKSTGRQGALDHENIIYVEKDMFEQSIITPHDAKPTMRKDDNIEKKYRLGVYGGKPLVQEF
ncbi:MAG: ATP-binding protein [Candidatus Nomurabacteria bacterium]|nr:ATP-binding protein [Candidatus Nomurabacteria bacterium]